MKPDLGTNYYKILFPILTISLYKMHLQMLSAKHGPLCFGLSVLRFKLMIGPRGRFRLGRRGGLIRLWLENIGAIKVEKGDKAQALRLWQVYLYIKNHYLENDSYHFGTGSHSTNKIVVVVCKQHRCYFGNWWNSCGHTIISLTWESPYLERSLSHWSRVRIFASFI